MKRCIMMGSTVGAMLAAVVAVYAAPYDDKDEFEIKTKPDVVWQLRHHYDMNVYEQQRNPTLTDRERLLNNQGPFDLTAGQVLTPAAVTIPDLPLTPDTEANSQFNAQFFQRGNDWFVGGTLHGWGHALNQQPGDACSASTWSRIETRTTTMDRSGSLNWRPTWAKRAEVHEGDHPSEQTERGKGSVDVTWRNLDTGAMMSTRLVESVISVSNGMSMFEAGVLSISAMRGLLNIEMESPYLVSPHGSMLLQFDQGLVTTSFADGAFAGLLPSVGTSSLGIMIQLGDPQGYFSLDYDFGETSASGFDVTFDFSVEGSAEDIPSPGSIPCVLLGIPAIIGGRRRRA